VLSILELLKYH
jgi:histone deacetylase 1/2